MNSGVFRSFILGGFECSTHRLRSGKRLDLLRSTRHDELAASDYRLLQQHGIRTARDGLRWHLIEPSPGVYDFSSATGMLKAARDTGMQVIWDLWHYGWPDGLDIFSAEFVSRFAAFAREAAKHVSDYDESPLLSPINENLVLLVGGRRRRHLQPVCQAPGRRGEASTRAREHRGGPRDAGGESLHPNLPDRPDHQRGAPW